MTSAGAYISRALRERITDQAGWRCGYCLAPEELPGMRLTLDHITPQVVGGETSEQNLWLACRSCNQHKGAQTHARDPESGRRTALFHPRIQRWDDHFKWDESGTAIVGTTPTGRATVEALRMNHQEIVVTRRLWVSAGWWPPRE
ncbi:MAG: HNH endonuclease [Chloroflexi bacterium]|nr:HNH endonuclease [Chloroflexota bacterium]